MCKTGRAVGKQAQTADRISFSLQVIVTRGIHLTIIHLTVHYVLCISSMYVNIRLIHTQINL